MEKVYRSNTHLSVNIVVGQSNQHVSFTPQSDGSSQYRTTDEAVQRGLERHYKYGRLFRLVESAEEHEAEAEAVVASEAEAEDGLTAIPVTDWDSAKDWLAEHTDVTRSQLRSQKSIVSAAAANGYEFVIPE